MTTRARLFNVHYAAGMASLVLVLTVVALNLNDEHSPGFVGTIEIPVLLIGAMLFVAAAVGATRTPGATWPLVVALVGTILVGVLGALTFTEPDASSAVIFELVAAVLGAILVLQLRNA